MYYVERVLVHLLNYESHSPLAPDVIGISDINHGVNVQLADLALFQPGLILFLSIKPVIFDRLGLAILNKLVNDVVNFEIDAQWLVPEQDSFRSVEVTDEAGLL